MKHLVVIIGALFFAGATETAAAQDAACEGNWQEAREARAAGNLVEARRLLEATMQCDPSVSAAFNLAAVLRDMGRYSDARHYLLGLLDGQFGEVPTARRGIVEAELQGVEDSLGMLEVTVEPAAELRLNGSPYGTFRGARALTLDPGEWSLELRAEGFRPRSDAILLRSGQRLRVRYELEPVGGDDGDDGDDEFVDGVDGMQRDERGADEAPRNLLPRRLGIALAVIGVVSAALIVGLVVRANGRGISDPVFGNPST